MFRLLAFASCMCLVNLNCQSNLAHDQQDRKINDMKVTESSLLASKPWQKMLTTDDSFSSITFGDDLTGIATGTDQRFWITSNGGLTWREQRIGNEIAGQSGSYSLAGARITSCGDFLVLGHLEEVGSAVFKSLDGGKTWKATHYANASLNAIDSV